MSLLFLYRRIFGVVRPFRIALWLAAFCVIGYWIACTILAFTGCHPVAKNWDKTVPGGCVDLIAFFRWNGICNLIIDFLILCLPMPMVWRLRITIKQKLVLCSIFALGLLYVVMAFIRRMLSGLTLYQRLCLVHLASPGLQPQSSERRHLLYSRHSDLVIC